jgi:hypothetical protein
VPEGELLVRLERRQLPARDRAAERVARLGVPAGQPEHALRPAGPTIGSLWQQLAELGCLGEDLALVLGEAAEDLELVDVGGEERMLVLTAEEPGRSSAVRRRGVHDARLERDVVVGGAAARRPVAVLGRVRCAARPEQVVLVGLRQVGKLDLVGEVVVAVGRGLLVG